MTYTEKLRDPRWQKRRLDIMQRDDFACVSCSAKDKTLNVDHKFYKRGLDPWEYDDNELQTLCEDCHKNIGKGREALTQAIGELTLEEQALVGKAILSLRANDSVLLIKKDTLIEIPETAWTAAVELFIATRKYVNAAR